MWLAIAVGVELVHWPLDMRKRPPRLPCRNGRFVLLVIECQHVAPVRKLRG
jgi:hypothetical protein